MATIGIRELKTRTSELLRRVRENGEVLEVTYHGRPVARVVPVQRRALDDQALRDYWQEWDALAARISSEWVPRTSAVEAVREQRRNL